MTAIEHKELKGITIRNLVVTIVSTASIVASVMTTYFQLKDDIHSVSARQETQARVEEVRLKILESEVAVLQRRVDEIKSSKFKDQSRKLTGLIFRTYADFPISRQKNSPFTIHHSPFTIKHHEFTILFIQNLGRDQSPL